MKGVKHSTVQQQQQRHATEWGKTVVYYLAVHCAVTAVEEARRLSLSWGVGCVVA